MTEVQLGGSSHQRSFSLQHSIPLFFSQKLIPTSLLNMKPPSSYVKIPATLSLRTELETTQTKHSSREQSFSLALNSQASPWSLRYVHAYRRNTLDAFSSHKFLEHDALPSMKHALALDYNIFADGVLSRMSFELASPMLGLSGRGDST